MSSVNSIPIENKPLEEIQAYAAKVEGEKEEKAERYQFAKLQLSLWEGKKAAARSNLNALRARYGNDDSRLRLALSRYDNVCSSYTDARINEDVCLSSYRDSIFSSAKFGMQALVAEQACR